MNGAINEIKTQETEFRYAAKKILDLIPLNKGRLLDVGCGVGWVTDEAEKRGFKAVGIDSNSVYIDEGRKYLNGDLRTISLEEFTTKERFDVVVLKHVLEHIIDPKNFLSKIRKLMKPNGYLIVSCPNMHSIMARIFLEKWYGLVPMEHRWQYTQNNLPQLLDKNGYIVKKVVLSNMWYKVPGFKGIIFKIILLLANITNSGDLITVMVQRP